MLKSHLQCGKAAGMPGVQQRTGSRPAVHCFLSCKAGPGMGCLMMIKVMSARHALSTLVPHL
jgi:hypothetical protein